MILRQKRRQLRYMAKGCKLRRDRVKEKGNKKIEAIV